MLAGDLVQGGRHAFHQIFVFDGIGGSAGLRGPGKMLGGPLITATPSMSYDCCLILTPYTTLPTHPASNLDYCLF